MLYEINLISSILNIYKCNYISDTIFFEKQRKMIAINLPFLCDLLKWYFFATNFLKDSLEIVFSECAICNYIIVVGRFLMKTTRFRLFSVLKSRNIVPYDPVVLLNIRLTLIDERWLSSLLSHRGRLNIRLALF